MRRCWSEDTKLHLRRMNNPRDLMHNTMAIVNIIVLYTRNSLRIDFRCFNMYLETSCCIFEIYNFYFKQSPLIIHKIRLD